jgi:glucose-6-phosphate isomerase
LALFERAVSIYALLVNINAYHQPAVEMGKKSAGEIIALKNKVVAFLQKNKEQEYTIEELTNILKEESGEDLFKILQHVVNNPDHGIIRRRNKDVGKDDLFQCLYSAKFFRAT